MERKIYVCNMCGKETKNYKDEAKWIHIDSTGLYYILYHDRKDEDLLIRCKKIIAPSTDSIDFCCLGCFVEWLLFQCADEVYVRKNDYEEFTKAPNKEESYSRNCRYSIDDNMKTVYDMIMRKRIIWYNIWDNPKTNN